MKTAQLIFSLLFVAGTSLAQQINLQSYTPSAIMQKGQVELKLFNNLYTQSAYYNAEANKQQLGHKESYFTSTNYALWGVTPWLNAGGELWVNSVTIQTDPSQKRTAIGYAGPKFKIAPFKSIERFSITSTLLIPLASNMQGGGNPSNPFLAYDNFIWINQIFFDRNISSKWQVFFELSGWTYFKRPNVPESSAFFRMPAKAIISWFPNAKITVYGLTEYMPQFGANFIDSYYFQAGGGAKYQLIPGKMEVETLYTKFLAGKSQGAGQTFNLGIRFVL